MLKEQKNIDVLEQTGSFLSDQKNSPLLRIGVNGDILYASPGCTHLLACWNSTIGKTLPDELLDSAQKSVQLNQSAEIKVMCNGNSYSFFLKPSIENSYVDFYSDDLIFSKESQFKEFQKQNRQLKRIAEISTQILELSDVDSVLYKIVENGIKLLDGSAGGIYTYVPQKDILVRNTGVGPFEFGDSKIQRGQQFCGKVWKAEKILVEPNYTECKVANIGEVTKQTIIGAPLFLKGEIFGVLCICRCGTEANFSGNDIELFEKYTALAAVTIKNAKFYEKANKEIKRRQQAELIKTVLFKISDAAGNRGSLKEMLAQIHSYVGELIDTRNFYIALYEPEIERYKFPYFVDEEDENTEFAQLDLRKSLTDYVRRTGEPLFVDLEKDEELRQSGQVMIVGSPSPVWMGAPLKTEHGTIGVVVVQHYHDENAYTKKDLQILSFVSDNIARAIERKRAQERINSSLCEKEFLLQEIHHRVKNNLQIISSLLYLQSKKVSKELVAHFEDSQNRIRTMALIHENLYRSDDFANINFRTYVHSLTNQLLDSYKYNGKKISIELTIDDVSVPIEFAVPCGLIINELVTNSLKYGFPKANEGRISILLKNKGLDEVKCLKKMLLLVKDDGIGLPEDFDLEKAGSLGLQLVNNLVSQLDGDFEICAENGTCFRINLFM